MNRDAPARLGLYWAAVSAAALAVVFGVLLPERERLAGVRARRGRMEEKCVMLQRDDRAAHRGWALG